MYEHICSMFGISFGEIMITAIIGLLVLKPGDFRAIYIKLREWMIFVNKETEEIKRAIDKMAEEEFKENHHLYDVSEIISLDLKPQNKELDYGECKKSSS